MTLEAAKIIASANSDLEVRDDYSGRGMYGSQTAGIVGSEHDFFLALSFIMTDYDGEDRQTVADSLEEGIRTDNMGLNIIFY